ncbi:MAG: large subunit ribosomal protein L31 [Flavobacteriaceae bacterium]|jgi:large subunit ribosomal protein L31
MKKDTHPQYSTKTAVTCICGAAFDVGSTLSEMKVEICSQCHPFYTGNEKVLDTAGRVDKFKKRREASEALVSDKPTTKKKEVKEDAKKEVKEVKVEEIKNTEE